MQTDTENFFFVAYIMKETQGHPWARWSSDFTPFSTAWNDSSQDCWRGMTVARMIKVKETLGQVGPLAKSVVSLKGWPGLPASWRFTLHCPIHIGFVSNPLSGRFSANWSVWCWDDSIGREGKHGCSSNKLLFDLSQPICSFKAFRSQVLPDWMFRRRRCAVIRLGSSIIGLSAWNAPVRFPLRHQLRTDPFQKAYCKLSYENTCFFDVWYRESLSLKFPIHPKLTGIPCRPGSSSSCQFIILGDKGSVDLPCVFIFWALFSLRQRWQLLRRGEESTEEAQINVLFLLLVFYVWLLSCLYQLSETFFRMDVLVRLPVLVFSLW